MIGLDFDLAYRKRIEIEIDNRKFNDNNGKIYYIPGMALIFNSFFFWETTLTPRAKSELNKRLINTQWQRWWW